MSAAIGTSDYVSLVIIIIGAAFWTLLYFWKREIPLSALSIVFWFTAAGLWVFTTTTPATSFLFWGLGIIMIVYTIGESIEALGGRTRTQKRDEEYEESGLDI